VTTMSASDPVLVDSSGWLEFITSDTKAALFDPYIRREGGRPIIVPTIVLYEVRKVLLLRKAAPVADRFLSQALLHTVVPIDQDIALSAASISVQSALAMADALLYATAEKFGAELVTSDVHFKGLPRVTLL
jgi:predicted nucleic acid-binding protein